MYYILHKNNELIGVSPFITSTQQEIPGVSFELIDEPIPDMNNVVWDSELLTLREIKQIRTKLEFLSLLTMAERIAISTSMDMIVKDIMELFSAAEEIDIGHNETIQGLYYFYQVGLLTAERLQEVLNA